MRRRDDFGCAFIPAIQACTGRSSMRRKDFSMGNLREDIQNGAAELSFRFGAADWLFVKIPPGKFMMGTPMDEPGRESWEIAPRPVRISRPFYMGKHETTNAQYR